MLLGAFPLIRPDECEITLEKGDSLILYTDGITEARSEADFFDESRLEAVLSQDAAASASQIAEDIWQAVNQFTDGQPQSDDMTLVIVQRDP